MKIFEEDSYLKELETKVKSIDNDNKLIELEKTIFYGRSGGQPGDTGFLKIKDKNFKVIETIKKNNSIFHQVSNIENIEIQDEVIGSINWYQRYIYMKMHTALHILCSVVPMDVTGGQIGLEKSRLDFNADAESINKQDIQEKINDILKDNHKILYEWITNEELDKNPELVRTMSVKPPKTEGKIRLVKIGEIDLQPCGGTHVKETKEIGSITIGKIENKGKMNRRININISD
tara:strand:+ start:511 stop:1209 length:699 start_codon:yes stop_codon:yes gene_type:complete